MKAIRLFIKILVLLLAILLINSCSIISKVPDLTKTPEPIPTMLTAMITGIIEYENGCIVMTSQSTGQKYHLVFPSDTLAVIDGNKITFTEGLITGSLVKQTFTFGDTVTIGGGSADLPEGNLWATLPANCTGPYWIFSGIPIEKTNTIEP